MECTEGRCAGYGGLSLYYRCWQPAGRPKAVLLVVPGLAEHCGRYGNLVDHFVPRGYAVYGFDHRGHGRSEGRRGYVARFEHYLRDLRAAFEVTRGGHPGVKVFLLGHSMGATVATAYAARYQSELAGLIVSAATVKPGDSITPAMIAGARVLSLLLPRMGVAVLDASAISRDRAVVDAYIADPLVYRGRISARLGAEILGAMCSLPRFAAGITLPVLILQGTDDRLSDPAGSQMLYRWITSSDKTLKLYEGFYHEVFNEPGRRQVFSDIEEWLDARV